MANKKTYTTTFKFDVEGIKKVEESLKSLSNIVPDTELKEPFEKLAKDILNIFQQLQKGVDPKQLGLEEITKRIDTVSSSIGERLKDSLKGVDISALQAEIERLEGRIQEGRQKSLEIEEKLQASQERMIERMKSGEFGIKADETYLDTGKVRKKVEEIDLEIESTVDPKEKKKLEELKESWRLLAEALRENVQERRKIGAAMGGTMRGLNKNKENLIKTQEELAKAQKVDEESLKEEEEQLKKTAAAYNILKDAQAELLKVKKVEAQKETTKVTKEQEKATKKLKEEEKELEEVIESSEKSMLSKVAAGFSYFTIFNQIKKAINAAIRAITELDKAMTRAAIVTSMTRKETWSLLKSYQDLAYETGKTTSEIADLNAFFLQQGKNMKQAMEMTEAAAKSAAVAGVTLQEAANYLTSAIHGFGLAASEAENVGNKFAALGAKSASSFEEIAIAMSKVAPVAQSAGVNIDFMMGILAKGIHTTREAPEAIGTAMKTIFARMRELTDIGKATEDGMSLNRVEKALNSIGVNLRDVSGQFRDLDDVLTDVGMKWKDLESLEQAYLATALAGTRQQPRLLAILNDFDTTMDMIETSRQAEDQLKYQHLDYLESMEAASNQLSNSWQKLTTSIVESDVIIGIFKGFAGILSTVADVIGFITERTGLLIGVMLIILALTHKHIIALGKTLAVRAANILGITKETFAQNSLILAFKANLAARRKEALEAAKRNALSPVLVSVNLAEAASWKLVGKAILETIAPMLIFLAAAAAITTAVYGLVKIYQHATKTVDDYGNSITKANKKIHDSQTKSDDLQELIEEYQKLEKQVFKTNEELERMKELREDMSHFQDGDQKVSFIDAYGEVDYNKIEEFEKKQREERDKAFKESLKVAGQAIRRFGIEAFDNPEVRSVFEEMGKSFTEEVVSGIEDSQIRFEVSRTLDTFLGGLDFKDVDLTDAYNTTDLANNIISGIAVLGGIIAAPFTGGTSLGFTAVGLTSLAGWGYDFAKRGVELTEEQMEEYETLVEEALELFINSHETLQGIGDETLSTQLDTFKTIIDQLDDFDSKASDYDSKAADAFKKAYPNLVKLDQISTNLNISSKELEKTIDNLEKRDIKLDVYLNFAERFGLATEGGADYYVRPFEEQLNREKFIKDLERDIDVRESNRMDPATTARLRSELNRLKNEYANAMEYLSDEDWKEYTVHTFITGEGESFYESLIEGSLTEGDVEKSIEALTNSLVKNLKIGRDEASKYAASVFEGFTYSYEDLLEKTDEIADIVTKAFDLDDDIAKGDYRSFFSLADRIGKDGEKILDQFLKDKDSTALQKAIVDNLDYELGLEIERLESVGAARTAMQDRHLEGLLKLREVSNDLVHIQEIWNRRIEETGNLIDRMKGTQDLLDRLEDLEIEAPEGMKELFETHREAALISAEQDLQLALDELERSKISGNIDKYYQHLANFEEASNQYLDILENEMDKVKKQREEEIKQIEDFHKESMDMLKKQHDEKWKAINYENKILDLQEKINAARNRLAAAIYGQDMAGEADARKALKQARQDRQQEIEAQILDRIQKEEEIKRDERLEELQEKMSGELSDISDKITDFFTEYSETISREELEYLKEIAENTKQEESSRSADGAADRGSSGGGLFSISSLIK